jgi:hypothetical protein
MHMNWVLLMSLVKQVRLTMTVTGCIIPKTKQKKDMRNAGQ